MNGSTVRKVNSLTGRGFNSTPPPPHIGNKMAKAKTKFVKPTGGKRMVKGQQKTANPAPKPGKVGKARRG